MKKWKMLFGIGLGTATIFSGAFVSARLPVDWEPGMVTGPISTTEGSPLELTKEDLTFTISGTATRDDTKSRLSSSYTFYNPTDTDVSVKMLVPFHMPYYYYSVYKPFDCSDYKITVDNAEISNTLHYVYGDIDDFNLNNYLANFSEDYFSGDIYSKDTKCYKYTLSFHTSYEGTVYFDYQGSDLKEENADIVFDFGYYLHTGSYLSANSSDEETITVYSINKDVIDKFIAGLTYTYLQDEEYIPTDGSFTRVDYEETTLLGLTSEALPENFSISEMDWFNAFYCMYTENKIFTGLESLKVLKSDVIPSFYYEMNVDSHASCVNTFEAPLYPCINDDYSPILYTYKYLLAPLSTWHSVQNLTITIKTDLYLIDPSFDFEETEDGYVYHSATLPTTELRFGVSTSDEPEKSGDWAYWLLIIGGALICGIPLIIIVSVILVVVLSGKKKKREAGMGNRFENQNSEKKE